MTKTAEIITFDDAALDSWRKRLDAARGNAVEQLIEFGAQCYEFQQACERKQGGSTFSAKMLEWYGISKAAASMWASLGEHKGKLFGRVQTLPASMDALYMLCEVPAEVLDAKVTRGTTVRQARELKKQHGTQQKKPGRGIGWINLLVDRLGITHGSLRDDRAKIEKVVGNLPNYFTDEAEANTFVEKYVRLIGVPKAKAEERVAQTRADLNAAQQKKLDAAVNAEWTRLNAKYHEQVASEVNRRTAEQLARLEKLEEEAKETTERNTARAATIIEYMTQDEYNLILNCLHPDRAPEDRKERFEKAFITFRRLEGYVNYKLPLSVLRERGWSR